MSAAQERSSLQPIWRERLGSALRTALACTMVGCVTLYGPESLHHVLAFPAFSYVTTILIVSDATLGDALRGGCHALYASIQVIIPSIMVFSVIGPERFTPSLAAAAVAANSFVVALPESTHLMAKRIAFGQAVIVYVGAVIHGAQTGAVMHPVRVASSTALGALASVLAMLFPYPRLAYCEVRRTCRFYAENVGERLNLLVEAFYAKDRMKAIDLITEAETFSKSGAKFLQKITERQEGMLWERPELRFSKPNYIDPVKKLQDLEVPIRGMELALNSCNSFPLSMVDEELGRAIENLKSQIGIKLEQAKCSAPFDVVTAPEGKEDCTEKHLQIRKRNFTSHEDLSSNFFLYCMEVLRDHSLITQTPEEPTEKGETIPKFEEPSDSEKQRMGYFDMIWGNKLALYLQLYSDKLVFALKCSLSLGLAVLFGLIYTRENGYWSGLTIAISFVTGRQPTFAVTNARAQGTAMGSVYGILCCFLFRKFVDLRLLPLLPWVIFTSFLRHSRMYGQAGGISAVIGALLILGRKNYGTPSDFAIARITEATIGLTCFLIVEILLKPTRAATLAKAEVSQSLRAFQGCVEGVVLCIRQKETIGSISRRYRGEQRKLKSHVCELENYIADAEMEPNFWFSPFHVACYRKLHGSLSKTVDLLLFAGSIIEFLSRESAKLGVDWKELQEQINDTLELFADKCGSSLKCLYKVVMIKSLAQLEHTLQKKNTARDIEFGKSTNTDSFTSWGLDEDDAEEIASSFLQHSEDIANKIHDNEVEEKLKGQMVLCICGLGFCVNSLMRETIEIEKEIRELVKRENPGRHINFDAIVCKLNTLNIK